MDNKMTIICKICNVRYYITKKVTFRYVQITSAN